MACSLFVAVIVDNLARVQAAANYNKLNLKKKKVPDKTREVILTVCSYDFYLCINL